MKSDKAVFHKPARPPQLTVDVEKLYEFVDDDLFEAAGQAEADAADGADGAPGQLHVHVRHITEAFVSVWTLKGGAIR